MLVLLIGLIQTNTEAKGCKSNTKVITQANLNVKSAYELSQVDYQAGAYPGFCRHEAIKSISNLPSIKFAGVHLYIWVEREAL